MAMSGTSAINSATHGMSGMVSALQTTMTIVNSIPITIVLIATAPTQ